MKHFTEEQLAELQKIFGLTRDDVVEVSDGCVNREDKVWWHNEYAPELVNVSAHLANIRKYPKFYSITRPAGRFKYSDKP